MKFLDYSQLIEHLSQIPTQKEQVKEMIKYFEDNVQIDYVMIEHINEIVTVKFTRYVDRLFPNISERLRKKALAFLRNSTNISNEYLERISKLYLTPSINDKGEENYITLSEALMSITADCCENNGLLTKGTSKHITEFAKRLCDDLGIRALIIEGISNDRMRHFWLDICIDGQELFYDITYALYIRDNFCGIGKRYVAEEWLGITPKQLYKNQPTRIIAHPKGFSLENLGLNNSPLRMKDFFDTSA